MKFHFFTILLASIFILSCTKEEHHPDPSVCTMSTEINGIHWCGETFEIYQLSDSTLVINGSKESSQPGVDFEQITLYVSGFKGIGRYQLKEEGSVYREWCCGDHIVSLSLLDLQMQNQGEVNIETYLLASGKISGKFEFSASGNRQIIATDGNFSGTLE